MQMLLSIVIIFLKKNNKYWNHHKFVSLEEWIRETKTQLPVLNLLSLFKKTLEQQWDKIYSSSKQRKPSFLFYFTLGEFFLIFFFKESSKFICESLRLQSVQKKGNWTTLHTLMKQNNSIKLIQCFRKIGNHTDFCWWVFINIYICMNMLLNFSM